MASWIDKIVDGLSSQEIKDFISGKTAPTIKTDNTVTVDNKTIDRAGAWILGGFIGSAVLIGLFIKWGTSSAAKYIVRNSRN